MDLSLLHALFFTEIFGLGAEQEGVQALYPKLAAYFSRLEASSRGVSPGLALALAARPLPPSGAPQAAWEQYAQTLRTLARTHRDVGHEWELDRAQSKRVEQYLKASQLLVDCLAVAYLGDREGVLEGVLRVEEGAQ
ncbi:MAG: hypothetical protein ACE5GO_03570 [Anaerolineales bacterium]